MKQDRTAVLERGMRIGDRWVMNSRGGTMEHINPASGRVNTSFSIASLDEVDECVAAARAAFAEWRRWSPDARRDVLLRLADLLVANAKDFGVIAALERGLPYSEHASEHAAEWIRYYAGWADKITGESINAYPMRGLDFSEVFPAT